MFDIKTLRNLSLSALSLIAISNTASAFSADYYTGNSKFSSGKWVKMTVSNNGIYQLTYDQLRELGFSDPSKVAVFGYGGAQLTKNTFDETFPDDIKQTASYHTSDDRLLFYGEGPFAFRLYGAYIPDFRQNVYSTSGTYFLSDCESPETLSVTSWRSKTNLLETYYRLDMQDLACQNPGKGGAVFHGPQISAGDSHSFTFNIKDFDSSSQYNYYGLFQYYFSARSTKSTQMTVTYPDNANITSKNNYPASYSYNSTTLYQSNYGTSRFTKTDDYPMDDTDITFTVTLPSTSPATYAAINKGYVIYPRKIKLGDDSSLYINIPYVNSNQNFAIYNAPQDAIVWNVSDVNNIFSHATHYDSTNDCLQCSFDKIYSADSGSGRFIIFDPNSQFSTPTIAGEVSNQNIHADQTPDMVIITTDALYQQAEQLANAHRQYQGLTVNVYRQSEVFNEFASGTPCAMAYRRLAKMFYDRDSEKFKYLLLYGAGSWDNRGISEIHNAELLLTYEVEIEKLALDSGSNFTSDNYFGLLEDEYTPANIIKTPVQIAVGRIPAIDPSQAQNYNDKIISLLANPQAPQIVSHAVMLSDDGNALTHLDQSEEAISTMAEINPSISFTKVHNVLLPWENGVAEYGRRITTDALTAGAGYMSYSGHGNAESFTGEKMWDKQLVESITYSEPVFGVFATCDALAFDRLDHGIGESMLFRKVGGAHSVVAACRSVFLEYNQHVNLALAKQYAAATSATTTIGDIYRNAKNSIIESITDDNILANAMCYNLGGDPAIPVFGAANSVAITKINDTAINDDTTNGSLSVDPINSVKIEGQITDADGNVNTDFNGNVLLTLFEAPKSMDTYTGRSSDDTTSETIEVDQTELAKTYAKVTNGVFSTSVFIPTPIAENGINRLTAYAIDSDNNRASGVTYAISVGEAPANADGDASISAPEIVEAYINDSSFCNGDIVNSDFTYHALINPSEAGLNIAQNSIGTATSLVLDGTRTFTDAALVVALREDGLAELSLDIDGINDGNHSLTLTVANNNGQRASRTIDFSVIAADASALVSVEESPARTSATINLEHTFTTAPESRLIIQATDGTTVFSQQNCSFPYTWNLRDLNGDKVANGSYRAFVVLNSGVSFTSSNAAEIIVLQ